MEHKNTKTVNSNGLNIYLGTEKFTQWFMWTVSWNEVKLLVRYFRSTDSSCQSSLYSISETAFHLTEIMLTSLTHSLFRSMFQGFGEWHVKPRGPSHWTTSVARNDAWSADDRLMRHGMTFSLNWKYVFSPGLFLRKVGVCGHHYGGASLGACFFFHGQLQRPVRRVSFRYIG